ncbi:MAG: hypothetical protein U9Q29_00505 [Campylobacterota bacterium]|nr:hypothetical protein [Campylobacterota bacterium]
MKTKQELMEDLLTKLNIAISTNLFNPQNGTITKDGLIEISNGITKLINKHSDKQTIVQHINSQLGTPPDTEHIGNNRQISAKFIEDILTYLPRD